MDLTQVMTEVKNLRKDTDSAAQLLGEISRLDQNRADNLFTLRKRLLKLDTVIMRLGDGNVRSTVADWAESYRRDLATCEEQVRKVFGVQLEQALRQRGLPLSGQYPELRSGWLTLEVDFCKWQVQVWYGPRQERLAQCHLSVMQVADSLERVRRQLGSELTDSDVRDRLHDAYVRAASRVGRGPVPVGKVLTELKRMFEVVGSRRTTAGQAGRAYRRSDFSYDLYRIRRAGLLASPGASLRLLVATRALTKRGEDFLWIPDDESGKGTTFSHLHFEEGTL